MRRADIVGVLASKSVDPVQSAIQLSGDSALPETFAKYVMDPGIPRIFVLVHDVHTYSRAEYAFYLFSPCWHAAKGEMV